MTRHGPRTGLIKQLFLASCSAGRLLPPPLRPMSPTSIRIATGKVKQYHYASDHNHNHLRRQCPCAIHLGLNTDVTKFIQRSSRICRSSWLVSSLPMFKIYQCDVQVAFIQTRRRAVIPANHPPVYYCEPAEGLGYASDSEDRRRHLLALQLNLYYLRMLSLRFNTSPTKVCGSSKT